MENKGKTLEEQPGDSFNAAKLLGELGVRHMRSTMAAGRERRRKAPEAVPLSLWREDALSRAELMAYVEAVTDENGKNYIPPKSRVAVTDMDGTLFCETDPTYFDFMLLLYRVLEDPDYVEAATAHERSVHGERLGSGFHEK